LVFGDPSASDSGSAFVVYGTQNSIGEIDADGRQIVTVSTLTSDQGFTITTEDEDGFIGFRVHTVGDINNDGLDDFSVSAPFFEDDLSPFTQGANFIVFGSEEAPGVEDANGVSVLNLFDFSASTGIRVIGSDPDVTTDALSVSSIGDFNGDGYDDLLAGSPDLFGEGDGEAYIIFGSETGIGTDDGNGNRILDLSTLTADTGIVLEGRSGEATAFFLTGIEDFNGDGFSDVIIGSAGRNFDGSNGSAFIVYGGSNVGELSEGNQRVVALPDLNALQGFEFRGQQDLDNVGLAISTAGDINNDGLPDIIINTSDSVQSSSTAVVIFGVPAVNGGADDSETLALVQENTTAAFVATSLGEGTIYTLAGDDAALFEINQDTGLVSFIDAPDFEAVLTEERFAEIFNNIDDPEDLEDFGFNLEVLAVNGDVSSVQEVAVTLRDANEFAPEFTVSQDLVTSDGLYFILAEDRDGTPIALADFDSDTNRFVFDDALTYEITGGVDAELFEIEVVDGSSGFAGLLNFIEDPAFDAPVDANGDGIYEVEVSVSDGEFITAQTFNLSVVENVAAPIFTGPDNFTLDEISDAFVSQISGEDPDGTEVIFFLAGGSFASDNEFFNIDFFTGELSFIGDAVPSFINPLDSNGDNVYEVEIAVTDGTFITNQTVTVTVDDVVFAPTLLTGFQTEFSENGFISFSDFGPRGSLITRDFDFDEITGSITGGDDADLFTFTANTFDFGEFQGFDLSSLQAFDFETPLDANGDNVYEIEITLSDGVNETVEILEFTILDVFESLNAPIFTTADTVQVNEGEQFVLTVNADDADDEAPTYSLQGADASLFNINLFTGELNFNFPIRFNQPDDFDDNFYTVEVIANDGTNNLTTQTIEIEVLDIDVAPTLSVINNFSLLEGDPLFAFVFADDSFDDQDLTVSLSGEDASQFIFTEDFSFPGRAQYILQLANETDFEMPADSDGDNVYIIDVTVTDGVNVVTETVTITIQDFFESMNAPVFVSPTTITANEGPFGSVISTVSATDADMETPTYSITGGDDRFRFNIDQTTGELSFSQDVRFNQPDDFGDNFYTIEVTADDGSSNQTTQEIEIEILDTDVVPTLNVQETVSVFEGDSLSLGVFASDNFDDQDLTVTISGVDAIQFTLQEDFVFSGFTQSSLQFVNETDFENPSDSDGDNIYIVDITVTDGVHIVTETVSVTVEDVFESPNAPVFVTPATIVANEGPGGSFISTLSATDADMETPTYSITGGDDRFLFDIEQTTGALFFSQDVRFNQPDDVDDNFYTIEVTADDGSRNQTTQEIEIEVLDFDNVPQLTVFGRLDDATILENEEFSIFLRAEDRFDQQDISITLGGPDADAFVFNVSSSFNGSTSGDLELVSALDFENPTDSNGDNIYEYEIIVSDGVNIIPHRFSLTVEDVFESANAPVFVSPATIMVDEGRRDTIIAMVSATDADMETPTYSITGGADGFRFRIDETTGELSLNRDIIFNQPDDFGDNFYTIEVTADDGSSNQTTQEIEIEILDTDVAPEFLSFGSTDTFVLENEELFISINVDDFFDQQELSITLDGPDADAFVFNVDFSFVGSISGRLELASVLDFENPADSDGDNTYIVDVIASDGLNIVTETYTVTVQDAFESPNTPVFTSPDTVSVDEAQRSVISVTAEDADGETVFLSITGGEDRNHFSIDNEGQLSFVNVGNSSTGFRTIFSAPDDSDGDNIYEVEITASDGTGNNTIQTLSVTVQDINVAPEFDIISTETTTPENERDVSLFILASDDFDLGDDVTLSIGGVDGEFFEFSFLDESGNSANGDIGFLSAPNFENPTDANGDNVYELDIIASDGVNFVSQTVTVTVEDVADIDVAPIGSPPVFVTSRLHNFDEQTSFELILEATDEDGDDLTYAITGGVDEFAFNLSGVDGNLLNSRFFADFSFPSDFNMDNVYEVEISVSDGNGNVSFQRFEIEVNDVNFVPTIDVFGDSVIENQVNTFAFINVDDAFDFDDTLVVTLSGVDADLFTLENTTGNSFVNPSLLFENAPDFENPLDADGDNIYELTLEVTDGVNFVTHDFTITVEDDPSDDVEPASSKALPDPSEMSVSDLLAELSDDHGELWAPDAALASFEVDTEGLIDLNETAQNGVSISDIERNDFIPDMTVYSDSNVENISAQTDTVALEMQFAADLLMLQESSAEVEG